MDERDAVARLKRGDWTGLEPLVRVYHPVALRTAYLITHDRALAEDLTQAAFLRAAERIAQFDADRPFGPWFLRIVVNDAVKAARRNRRQRPLPDDEEALAPLMAAARTWDSLPEMAAERTAALAAVRAALTHLSPAQRGLIVGRYYLGHSDADMGRQLGVPAGTVKSRLYAARARLRQLLASWRPDADGTWNARLDYAYLTWQDGSVTDTLVTHGLHLGRADLLRIADTMR